jgi:hypothetical protein
MFRLATALAREFTFPVVVSARRWDASVRSGPGAFIVLNADGWILTVAHLFDLARQHEVDRPQVERARKEIAGVESDTTLQPRRRTRELERLRARADRAWVTNISYWWSSDAVRLVDLSVIPEVDLAVGRLDPYPPDFASSFPVFKNPGIEFHQGTSLCRLGFPFLQVDSSFDEARNAFALSSYQLPFFPVDGIFTRELDYGRTKDGAHPILYMETTSPGLRGQSGGPIYDVQGRIWGLQSRTQHIPLGFDPKITVNGREMVEHQFMNLGQGVHPETIISVLTSLGVAHQVSPD